MSYFFYFFLTSHRLLTERLIKQGFWHSRLCLSFKKFAKRHSAVSVRNHIMKGICIPLDVRRDLVKNVTTWRRGQYA